MMTLDSLPFNWFDLVVVAAIVVGLRQGRKNGASGELMPLLKWIALVAGCAFFYQPIGLMIAQSPVFGLLASYLMAYCAVALVIGTAFAILKKLWGTKPISSETFGQSEFYLGMLAGTARYVCILVVLLALLNARRVSSDVIAAHIKYQNDVYGSNFFPTLSTVQAHVFETSLTGPWIRSQLGMLLIKPTAPDTKQLKQKEFAVP